MGKRKKKSFVGVAPLPEVDANLSHNEPAGEAQVTNVPQNNSPEFSPLTIALQKERGVYKKRKPYRCPPQQEIRKDKYGTRIT